MTLLTQWLQKSGLLTGIAEMETTGAQWVGWQWAVYLADKLSQVTGIKETRVLFVPLAISVNELVGCQLFGRMVDQIDKCLIKLSQPKKQPNKETEQVATIIEEPPTAFDNDWTPTTKHLKTGVSSAFAGIAFDTIDNIVSAACLAGGLGLPATLALRCLAVMMADRIVFHLGCEAFDRIKLEQWGQKFKANAKLSINAGNAAVGYNIAVTLADVISDAANIHNEWARNAMRSPFIFLGTSLCVPVGLIEKYTFWKITDCCSRKKLPTSHQPVSPVHDSEQAAPVEHDSNNAALDMV